MKFTWPLLMLAFLGASAAAQDAHAMFPDFMPFTAVGYEMLSDPNDFMSPLLEVPIDEIEPDGIGYRYFLIAGETPSIVGEDVCPAGYETVWYTFDSETDPIAFAITAEIEPRGSTPGEWFSPIFMDQYRDRAGDPVFPPPVHLGHCAYSDTRGDYRRSHTINTINRGALGARISCKIEMNNSGNHILIDQEANTNSAALCYGDQR